MNFKYLREVAIVMGIRTEFIIILSIVPYTACAS